ncbi:hypothetical protein [Pontimicrobium sp. MEBiC01747]
MMEYRIQNNNQIGFPFNEHWKSFFISLSPNIDFIDDDDYNFKYLTEGKIGISLEDHFIHIWFEEEKFNNQSSERIVQEFCYNLRKRYGDKIESQSI